MNYKKIKSIISITLFLFLCGNHVIAQNANEHLFMILDDSGYLYGYMNRTGKVVIQPQYPNARDFSENLAAVQVPGTLKWGYINRQGQFAIAPTFSEANDFSEGVAVVKSDNQIKIIDKTGKTISIYSELNDYEDVIIWGFHDGLARFSYNGHYGFINKQGKVVIRPTFDYVRDFGNGLAIARIYITNSTSRITRAGYIDKSGNFVWSETFKHEGNIEEENVEVEEPEEITEEEVE